jgi:hypothetical protein
MTGAPASAHELITKPMFTLDILRSLLDNLSDLTELEQHPLTHSALVEAYRRQQPAAGRCTAGQALGRAIAELWHEHFKPARLAPQFRREWNLFLTLELGWFYPFRHGLHFPNGLVQIGALLLDREQVALVIADGDETRARAVQQPETAEFWEALVPSHKKESLAISFSTIASRRDTALRLLQAKLEKSEAAPRSAEPEPVEPLSACPLDLEPRLPAAPTFIPEEWQRIIERARSATRLCLEGQTGSGKTTLLAAIAQDFQRLGLVPLVVRVSDYAPQAASLDLLRFAATQGAFGETYRAESARQAFEQELAAAQQADRLVVLADQCDDVLESEQPQVSQRLNAFRRLIVVERTPRLTIDRTAAISVNLPAASPESIVTLLTESVTLRESADEVCTAWQQARAQLNPALAQLAKPAADEVRPGHPVKIFSRWLDQLLHQTRSTGRLSGEADKARRLLRYLAAIRFDLVPHPDNTTELTRENVRRAFWQLPMSLAAEDQGWALIDFCGRAGILIAAENRWQFMTAELERTLAAEYAADQAEWISLRPQQRLLLHWTAALIAECGDESRTENFFKQLNTGLSSASPLSMLDAAFALREFNVESSAAAQAFKAFVLEQIESLRRIESERVRQRIEIVIQHLRSGVEPVSEECAVTGSIQPDQLERDVQNLAQVLGFIKGAIPDGDETHWLENRQVLTDLINGLRDAESPEIKQQCAAWLKRSTLAKTLEIHVPIRLLWKSRGRSALELIAHLAQSTEHDQVTRSLAYGILMKADFLLRLWQSGDEYTALVYDLLLVMDKRLFLIQRSPTHREWQILD